MWIRGATLFHEIVNNGHRFYEKGKWMGEIRLAEVVYYRVGTSINAFFKQG